MTVGTAVLFFLFFFKDFSFDDPGQDVNRHWGGDCAFVLFFYFFCFEFFFCGLFDDPCQDVDGNREDDGAVVLC